MCVAGMDRDLTSKTLWGSVLGVVVQENGRAPQGLSVDFGPRPGEVMLEVRAANRQDQPPALGEYERHRPDFDLQFIDLPGFKKLKFVVCQHGLPRL